MSFKKTFRLIKNNKKIIENYFFMTFLQVLNSFFYVLIYPYVIRKLGVENFGLYVYATGIIAYFQFFINFGFDLPLTKAIAENIGNKDEINRYFSEVFCAKFYLFTIATCVFILLVNSIDVLYKNFFLYSVCFATSISNIFFPQWYFQAIQNMRIVTVIQLGVKIITLPLIFSMVTNQNDLNNYALIISLGTLIGSLIAFALILIKYQIKIKIYSPFKLIRLFRTSFPYFLTSLAASIKEYSIPILLGGYFGMKEVAIYDLANKIILIPRTLVMSVNAAIFPKLIVNINADLVKKIIKLEFIISILIILIVMGLGNYAVMILGGNSMIASYYLANLLAVSVMSWLVVGAFINFVFMPNNKIYWITQNQILAMFSFFLIFFILIYTKLSNIYAIGVAIAISGLIEIGYCVYKTRRFKLL